MAKVSDDLQYVVILLNQQISKYKPQHKEIYFTVFNFVMLLYSFPPIKSSAIIEEKSSQDLLKEKNL